MDDETLEEKVAALPPAAKAFVEGYGDGVGGYDPGAYKEHVEGRSVAVVPVEGYALDFSAATHRICQRCGSVVADIVLHDEFHRWLDSKQLSTIESEVVE